MRGQRPPAFQHRRIRTNGSARRLAPVPPAARRRRAGGVRVGCTGWIYPHWREVVYPAGLPVRRWLAWYARLFDTVEVNATVYRLASPAAVASWMADTPDDFVFAVKASRFLTRMKRLADLDVGLRRFHAAIAPLAGPPKLGPVLWQLPERFARDDDRRARALEALPPGRDYEVFRGDTARAVACMQRGLAQCESTMHFGGNVLVTLDGDAARAECHAVCYHRVPVAGLPHDRLSALHYRDALVRMPPGWRIAERHVRVVWERFEPASPPPGPPR